MTELFILLLFAATLVLCVALHISILIALLIGLLLFMGYARKQGFSLPAIGKMSLSGIRTVRNILITFLFIGTLTALWRASGCIPTIVCYVSGAITPRIFLMLTFLLCSLVSFLTGTSFGTAATVGVICMSIARSMDLSVFWTGGAILSGAYWGDRCSPVSTSALLVSSITETALYDNIRSMLRTAVLPTLLAALVYLFVGLFTPSATAQLDVKSLFQSEFSIHPVCLVPAAAIFLLALCKVQVKPAMLVSILLAVGIALILQKVPVLVLLKAVVLGYTPKDSTLDTIIGGGGLVSMVRVAAIVCIASCYAGIFRETGLLIPLQGWIARLAGRTGPYIAVLLVSIPAAMIACNQTLSIMLTRQLVDGLELKPETLALYLEDSVVLIAALVPWSIAGSVPLATVGAGTGAMAAACFLYLLPLCRCFAERRR